VQAGHGLPHAATCQATTTAATASNRRLCPQACLSYVLLKGRRCYSRLMDTLSTNSAAHGMSSSTPCFPMPMRHRAWL
jgi:hypothetical protein